MLLLPPTYMKASSSACVPTLEQRTNLKRRDSFVSHGHAKSGRDASLRAVGANALVRSRMSACGSRFPRREMWRPLSSDACPSTPNSQLLRHT
jgi:hypothetical protein